MLLDAKFAAYVGKCAVEVSIGFIVSVTSVDGHPFAETVDASMLLEDFPGVTTTFVNHYTKT